MTPETGFEAIVTVHHAEIYRYLRRLTFRIGEAEDLSQETFFRAYRAWAALPSDANVRAWLFKIATNVFRNHARGERRRLIAHATVQASRREADPDGPEAAAVAGELAGPDRSDHPAPARQAADGVHAAQAARARL